MTNSSLKLLVVVLLVALGLLQYKLWFSSSGLHTYFNLQQDLQATQSRNAELMQRNQRLAAEIVRLKTSRSGVEEHARNDLGMVKPDETFYEIVPKADH